MCIHPTTCASAAGYRARARTNLPILYLAARRLVPARSPGPPWPVGCIRGSGEAARSATCRSRRFVQVKSRLGGSPMTGGAIHPGRVAA